MLHKKYRKKYGNNKKLNKKIFLIYIYHFIQSTNKLATQNNYNFSSIIYFFSCNESCLEGTDCIWQTSVCSSDISAILAFTFYVSREVYLTYIWNPTCYTVAKLQGGETEDLISLSLSLFSFSGHEDKWILTWRKWRND